MQDNFSQVQTWYLIPFQVVLNLSGCSTNPFSFGMLSAKSFASLIMTSEDLITIESSLSSILLCCTDNQSNYSVSSLHFYPINIYICGCAIDHQNIKHWLTEMGKWFLLAANEWHDGRPVNIFKDHISVNKRGIFSWHTQVM